MYYTYIIHLWVIYTCTYIHICKCIYIYNIFTVAFNNKNSTDVAAGIVSHSCSSPALVFLLRCKIAVPYPETKDTFLSVPLSSSLFLFTWFDTKEFLVVSLFFTWLTSIHSTCHPSRLSPFLNQHVHWWPTAFSHSRLVRLPWHWSLDCFPRRGDDINGEHGCWSAAYTITI